MRDICHPPLNDTGVNGYGSKHLEYNLKKKGIIKIPTF